MTDADPREGVARPERRTAIRRHGRPCRNCGGTLRYGPPGYNCIKCSTAHSKASKQTDKYKEIARRSQFERRYGVSLDRMREILSTQNNKCAICAATSPGHKHGWAMDHDHATLVIRGVLCHHCNVGLGGFKDSRAALNAAVQYLAWHSAKAATTEATVTREIKRSAPC